MTALRYRWCRPAAFAVTGATALLLAGISAAPASAHTPSWSVDCATVSVELTNYSADVANTVTIEADGKKLFAEEFRRDFHKKVELPAPSADMTVRLIIDAGDDDRFSRDESKTSPVCETPEEPSPSPSTSAPGTPEPSTSAPPSEEPSSSAPPAEGGAPAGGGSDLAETGGSDATPVIAGGAGVVLVAGAGLLLVARRRRAARQS